MRSYRSPPSAVLPLTRRGRSTHISYSNLSGGTLEFGPAFSYMHRMILHHSCRTGSRQIGMLSGYPKNKGGKMMQSYPPRVSEDVSFAYRLTSEHLLKPFA